MKNRTIVCALLFFLAFLPSLVFAQGFAPIGVNEAMGVRALSMGGAYRAVANSNEAVFFNPAGLAMFRRFEIAMDYDYRQYDKIHWAGASLVDSSSGGLAAALDFHMGFAPPGPTVGPTTELSYLGQLSLAYAIVDGMLAIGATGKYAHLPSTGSEGPIGRFTIDAALLLKLPFGLSMAAVGYNLIPVPSERLPLSLGLGAALNFGGTPGTVPDPMSSQAGFTLAFDWLMRDLDKTVVKHQLYTGAEYAIGNVVPLRAGYSYSLADDTHYLSVGIGLLTPVFAIDALYQQDIYISERRVVGGMIRFFI